MREIKFRGKRTGNGLWAYGYYLPWHATKDLQGNERYAQIFEEHENNGRLVSTGWWMVDPYTVGQYTGLKDKNGKEIYEGDIVAINKELLGCYIIKYDENYARFSMYINGYEQAGFNKETMKSYEVIGNIYDNPELLKEE